MSEPTSDRMDAQAWADHLWRLDGAVTLDYDHRSLAEALVEKVAEDPEQAAHLIAVLVQLQK